MKLSNHNQPTPAIWTKISAACVTIGATIGTYSLTQGDKVIGIVGLVFATIGAVLPIFTAEK